MWWDGPAAISQRRRCVRAFACLGGLLFGLLICEIGSANAGSEGFPYEDAVAYCRSSVTRPIALSDDRSVVCFDGYIVAHSDFSLVKQLKDGGLFVTRNRGGVIEETIALARLLQDKHAIVVVYDYCVSSCAAYLLIATDHAAVRKDSLVLWHFPSFGLPDCFEWISIGDDRPKALRAKLCDSTPEKYQTSRRQARAASAEFFRARTIAPEAYGDGLEAPQSDHVRRMLKNIMNASSSLSDVFWMWNPRYYEAVFKTKVYFESYPKSQAEVDALKARFGMDRVIFDP
jgi:hypothetical protein